MSETAPVVVIGGGAIGLCVAFYLRRTPLLVGVRQELRFGKSLEDSDRFVADLRALRDAAPHGRLYCLTDTREKHETELRDAVGPIELVLRNRMAALWVRDVSGR